MCVRMVTINLINIDMNYFRNEKVQKGIVVVGGSIIIGYILLNFGVGGLFSGLMVGAVMLCAEKAFRSLFRALSRRRKLGEQHVA